jgi:hypothetical protein
VSRGSRHDADGRVEVQGVARCGVRSRRAARCAMLRCGRRRLLGESMSSRVASLAFVASVVALALGALPAGADAIKNGALSKKQADVLAPYMGDYEGQWNSSITEDLTTDGISRYVLENPVMRLAIDAQNKLHLTFYMDRASAQANDELDLLGYGCRSRVGELLELDLNKSPKDATPKKAPNAASTDAGSLPYQVFAARLDFDWGNCPARVYAVRSNDLELALLIDDDKREYVVNLRLLKRMQPDNKVVIEDHGVQRVVKVRPNPTDPGSLYAPNMQYCVMNEVGEVQQCFDRETELKRFIVPFPFPGLSAVWWTKTTPNLKVVPGVKKTYHEAVFHRPIEARP